MGLTMTTFYACWLLISKTLMKFHNSLFVTDAFVLSTLRSSVGVEKERLDFFQRLFRKQQLKKKQETGTQRELAHTFCSDS
jgi:hypothetical protein